VTVVENLFSWEVPLRNSSLKMYPFLRTVPLREPPLQILLSRAVAYVKRL
jgi:hypothetical protein